MASFVEKKDFTKDDLQEALYTAESDTNLVAKIPWSTWQEGLMDILNSCPQDMTVHELRVMLKDIA